MKVWRDVGARGREQNPPFSIVLYKPFLDGKLYCVTYYVVQSTVKRAMRTGHMSGCLSTGEE